MTPCANPRSIEKRHRVSTMGTNPPKWRPLLRDGLNTQLDSCVDVATLIVPSKYLPETYNNIRILWAVVDVRLRGLFSRPYQLFPPFFPMFKPLVLPPYNDMIYSLVVIKTYNVWPKWDIKMADKKKINKMMRPISFILQKFLNKQGDEFYMCVK